MVSPCRTPQALSEAERCLESSLDASVRQQPTNSLALCCCRKGRRVFHRRVCAVELINKRRPGDSGTWTSCTLWYAPESSGDTMLFFLGVHWAILAARRGPLCLKLRAMQESNPTQSNKSALKSMATGEQLSLLQVEARLGGGAKLKDVKS